MEHYHNPLSDYAKVSCKILSLASNVVLRIVVILTDKTMNNTDIFVHREVEYSSSKFDRKMKNISLTPSYFLTIENVKPNPNNGEKAYIIISQDDRPIVVRALKHAYDEYNKNFSKIYAKRKGMLIKYGSTDPIEVTDLSLGKYLLINYDIVENKNGETFPGFRINLSSQTNYIVLSEKRFVAFLECLDKMDMFSYAMSLLNYVGRPELGTNLIDMDKDTVEVSAPSRRFIGDNKKSIW